MSEHKLEYSTELFWPDWHEVLRKAEEYSAIGWRAVTFVETDENIRVVFVREVQ